MELTITINAPGLETALVAVASQMERYLNTLPSLSSVHTPAPVQAPAPEPAPAPIAPPVQVTPPPATVTPIQTPTPVAPVQQIAPSIAAVPVAAPPTYTQQDMAKACVQLMDLKGPARISQIMAQFGVQALTQLDKAYYDTLAQVLRNEGVNI